MRSSFSREFTKFMDQSRCKYRLRSKGSLTNVTQPPPGFSGAFQPAFVLVVGDRWRDEPWWTSGATPRLLLSEYVKYAASGVGVRLADMRIEVPEASDQSPPALRRPATAQANQAITFIREWCIGLQPCLHEAIGGKRADQFVGRGFVPIRRQEAKQPFGDELVALRRPMPASGGARIGRRAIKGYKGDVRGLEMANQGGIGRLQADEEFGAVRFDELP